MKTKLLLSIALCAIVLGASNGFADMATGTYLKRIKKIENMLDQTVAMDEQYVQTTLKDLKDKTSSPSRVRRIQAAQDRFNNYLQARHEAQPRVTPQQVAQIIQKDTEEDDNEGGQLPIQAGVVPGAPLPPAPAPVPSVPALQPGIVLPATPMPEPSAPSSYEEEQPRLAGSVDTKHTAETRSPLLPQEGSEVNPKKTGERAPEPAAPFHAVIPDEPMRPRLTPKNPFEEEEKPKQTPASTPAVSQDLKKRIDAMIKASRDAADQTFMINDLSDKTQREHFKSAAKSSSDVHQIAQQPDVQKYIQAGSDSRISEVIQENDERDDKIKTVVQKLEKKIRDSKDKDLIEIYTTVVTKWNQQMNALHADGLTTRQGTLVDNSKTLRDAIAPAPVSSATATTSAGSAGQPALPKGPARDEKTIAALKQSIENLEKLKATDVTKYTDNAKKKLVDDIHAELVQAFKVLEMSKMIQSSVDELRVKTGKILSPNIPEDEEPDINKQLLGILRVVDLTIDDLKTRLRILQK